MRTLALGLAAGFLAGITLTGCAGKQESVDGWTAQELKLIQPLSLSQLPPPPHDPSNRYADDPLAAGLGSLLFNDPRLSRNGQIACATCHQPGRSFTDGLSRSRGLGQTARNAPSLIAAAWSPWQFWDGRADSLWSQALGPLTHPDEQGLDTTTIAEHIVRHYRPTYENVFGELPNPPSAADHITIAVNAAKSIAAFERTLRPPTTRFDRYVDALAQTPASANPLFTDTERKGLRLFIGRGQCLRCHSGPLLTNQGFHNTGLSDHWENQRRTGKAERGRSAGLPQALTSPYNCRSRHSDTRQCPQLDFAKTGNAEWLGAFKVPSLRQLGETAPYMHDGRFATLEEVISHYNRAPNLDGIYGHSELRPLGLSKSEQQELIEFLGSL